MADKTSKFTVKSDKVLGEESKVKAIVVDVPDTNLVAKSAIPTVSGKVKTPEIKTAVKDYTTKTSTYNVNLEIDLKGLGEDRQPDGLRFIYQPDIYTVTDVQFILTEKPFEDNSAVSDLVTVEFNPFRDHASLTTDEDFKVVESFKEDSPTAVEFVAQTIEKPFFDTYSVSDFNELAISPVKLELLTTEDTLFYEFEKSLLNQATISDDQYSADISSPKEDSSTVFDTNVKLTQKELVDITTLFDVKEVDFEKALDEFSIATDVYQFTVSKSLFDLFAVSDFSFRSTNKGISDTTLLADENIKDIVAGKLDVVVAPELVEKLLYKSIVDFVTATDDAFGNLNPDDDQTALTQRPAFDTSGVSDINYRVITKAIFDTVTAVEKFEIKDDSIKDISSITDLFIANLEKYLEDTAGNSDFVTLNPAPNKLDSAAVNDILTAVVSFFYNINDITNITTSGRINKQDYFLEEYTVDDYTGENFYF